MSTLIAYAGKNGTTKKCAALLSEKIPGSTVADLDRETPDLSAFDSVVIGSCIRMGQICKSVKKFLGKYEDQLSEKKLSFFICNGTTADVESIFEKNIPPYLLKFAITKNTFGGELDPEKLKGMDKIIAKAAMKAGAENNMPLPHIIYENIGLFAENVRGANAL